MTAATYPLSKISQEVWDLVQAEPRTPMRQYIWAQAYEETLARGEVKAVLVGSPEKPVALAPFAEPALGPARQILLGAEDLWESIEVAAHDEKSLHELATLIAGSGVPLRFGHHPTDTPFLKIFEEKYRGIGRVITGSQPMRAMPRIDLDSSWTEPESHFNSRRRSDFRRMVRKADALGEVTYEIKIPSPSDLEGMLDEAFEVESLSWKGRLGTAINQDRRLEAFYRSYGRRALEAGILRLCFMRIDGKPAAMQFAVESDDSFWLIKVGYDDAYKRVSPGNLLMRETISYAAQKGLKSYEFLGKEGEWTKLWADGARPIATVRAYPYNLRGLTAFLSDGASLMFARASKRLKRTAGARDA